MRMLSVTLAAFFAFFEVVKCGDNMHGSPWSRRHTPNADVAAVQRNTALEKRFDGVRLTNYAAGLGACGVVNVASDFIVALNVAQFDNGAHCFETITLTVNGKVTQATIMDECIACPFGGLDLTTGLFGFFGPISLGVLTGSWVFGGAAPTSTKSTPTPVSTSTYQPPPSSSSSSSSSSSVTLHTTNSTSTQTPIYTSSQSSISATPTPLIPSQETGNIANLFLILVEVESMLTVAHLQ